jgi:hypothetical protein
MFEQMLEIVTGDKFVEELGIFAEEYSDKFDENGAESTHEQFEIFQNYKKLIESVIDREMTESMNKPFNCAMVASKFNTENTPAVFEEVADVLNSLNDFLAFKDEMIAHRTSKDKQDLCVQTIKLGNCKQARSERIRNPN